MPSARVVLSWENGAKPQQEWEQRAPTGREVWARVVLEFLRRVGPDEPQLHLGYFMDLLNSHFSLDQRRVLASGLIFGYGLTLTEVGDEIEAKFEPRYPPVLEKPQLWTP